MSNPTFTIASNDDVNHLVDIERPEVHAIDSSSQKQLFGIAVEDDDSEEFEEFQRANTNMTSFGRDLDIPVASDAP